MSRRLTPEEKELWHKVAQTTDRMKPQMPQPKSDPVVPKPKARGPVSKPPLQDFELGLNAKPTAAKNDLTPSIGDQIKSVPLRMDQKKFAKMKRGKLVPEGKIDLHGMTMERAHPALTGFILRSHAQGKRLVLVITGKGKHRDDGGPIPVRFGVLKHSVPQWLRMAPLSSVVLQITEAHISHGGTGAYYVYLKRQR